MNFVELMEEIVESGYDFTWTELENYDINELRETLIKINNGY